MVDSEELKLQRERAAELLRMERAQLPQGMNTCPRRADLVRIGKLLWPHSYKLSQDDNIAFEMLDNWLMAEAQRNPELTALAASFRYLPQEQIIHNFSARWADQGFPSFQVGHKYAAALMATTIRAQDMGDVHVPFKAFTIEVPTGLLEVLDEEESFPVNRVLVQQAVNTDGVVVWNYMAMTTGRVSLWKHGVPTEAMTTVKHPDEHDWQQYTFILDIDDGDERVNALVAHLILGVCLAASSPDETKEVGKGHSKSAGQLRMSPEPETRVFKLGKPIKLDVRQTIKDYVAGTLRKSPSVQTLVRGHWKRQPYGPKASLRKWIWREPYWRGPEDAPILSRPHKLND